MENQVKENNRIGIRQAIGEFVASIFNSIGQEEPSEVLENAVKRDSTYKELQKSLDNVDELARRLEKHGTSVKHVKQKNEERIETPKAPRITRAQIRANGDSKAVNKEEVMKSENVEIKKVEIEKEER